MQPITERRLTAGTVFLAAVLVCLPALFLPFVFDDVLAVQNNYFLRHLANAAYLFRPAYSPVFRNEGYEPFTYIVMMLTGKACAWQPWGFHAVSILAHAACALLVYRLALLLTAEKYAALAAGLLFALHPAQAETALAAMFSGTIFSSIFFLWALHRFIGRDGRDGPGSRAFTALLYGVSLLFKERTFSGLLIFGLLPLLRTDGGLKELRRRAPELGALAIVWGAALALRTFAMQGGGFGFENLDPAFLIARLAAYAETILLPFWISPVYSKVSPLPDPAAIAALLLVSAAGWAALRAGRGERKYSPAAVGLALFLVILLPYLNVLPVKDLAEYLSAVFASNRYLYLPMAGASLVLAVLAGQIKKYLPGSLSLKLAGAAVLAALAVLSLQQQLLWRNEEKVWARAVELNPSNPWARYMLGTYYLQAGRADLAQKTLTEALARRPDRALLSNTYSGLAGAALAKNENSAAELAARKALETWQLNHDAWNTLGAALAGQGRNAEAAEAFEKAARIEITGDGPLVNLGLLYQRTGENGRAAEAFERALARRRSDYALDLLCRARAADGKIQEAARACVGAIELNPGRPDTLLLLGRIYMAMGAAEPAGLCLIGAVKLSGGSGEARFSLAELYARSGRLQDAVSELETAAAAGYAPASAVLQKMNKTGPGGLAALFPHGHGG